ncbi:MAG: YIEGIA domain-containing protein [Terrisporobacter sp.]|uniref:YIEGIA domain-containing protein n=1 Tax=Terrisporobacter sp. TaxID=1965305 RepID=UPI002FC73B93
MDKIFFIGVTIGVLSRVIMLNLDERQYPTQPNVLISQIVLSFVASSLGALLIPALLARSYSSITFLSLAAEQFRQVRNNRRDTLQRLESSQLVSRGPSFIEEIARTFEIRNYMCIVTSFLTVAIYYTLSIEFKIGDPMDLIISSISGLMIAYLLRRSISRDSLGSIAEVNIVDVSFVDKTILKVGDFQGLTNVALKEDRDKYLKHAIGIQIRPKNNSYKNASIISYIGQRQVICYNLYSRLGILKQFTEPSFTPLPRKNPKNQCLYLAFFPMEKDEKKVIEAIKSCPILSSARGKNIALSNMIIAGKENT